MSEGLKKILCIVGQSGSGKSTVADYISDKYNIPIIESWTDRAKRTPDEKGHTFVTPEEFDQFKREDMIAFTEFGGKRYCCFHSDVKDKNLYVIDPFGLEFLKNASQRIKDVSVERFKRDAGKFYLPDDYYDYSILNTSGKNDLFERVNSCVKYFGLERD